MPARLLITSDTHVPGRARVLPAELLRAADDADVIIHAGDWVAEEALDELERHGPVVGVWGNNDDAAVRARLPEIARLDIEGLRIAVVHETGQSRNRESRMEVAFGDADVLIFGHSHIPWDTSTPRGLRLLNPGSPTDRRRQPRCTYMTAAVDDGALCDVELIAL